jgi:TPR repeat protein
MPILPVVGGGQPARIAAEIEERLQGPVPDAAGAHTLHGLGVALFQAGAPAEPFFGQMARAFAAAAGAGLAEAWVDLGRCRWNGWGTPADPPLAVEAFQRAGSLGSLEGAFLAAANLGHLGRWEEAATWAQRAVELGDEGGDARTLLGRIALHGLGRPARAEEAVPLLEAAVSAGNPDAMMELSLLLESGRGIAADAERAATLLLEAALRGQPVACLNLGAAYATGRNGFRQDWAEAVRWYERASEVGSGRASFALALMYRRGQGVAQDLARADEFLDRAQAQGFDVEKHLAGRGG